MPDERVRTAIGDIDAYLIEARSMGGLSGSPVFVMLGNMRNSQIFMGPARLRLLGLMHGHFDLPNSNSDSAMLDAAAVKAVNMGIGIVVPANKIVEVLNHPKLTELRSVFANKWGGDASFNPVVNNETRLEFTLKPDDRK